MPNLSLSVDVFELMLSALPVIVLDVYHASMQNLTDRGIFPF